MIVSTWVIHHCMSKTCSQSSFLMTSSQKLRMYNFQLLFIQNQEHKRLNSFTRLWQASAVYLYTHFQSLLFLYYLRFNIHFHITFSYFSNTFQTISNKFHTKIHIILINVSNVFEIGVNLNSLLNTFHINISSSDHGLYLWSTHTSQFTGLYNYTRYTHAQMPRAEAWSFVASSQSELL